MMTMSRRQPGYANSCRLCLSQWHLHITWQSHLRQCPRLPLHDQLLSRELVAVASDLCKLVSR